MQLETWRDEPIGWVGGAIAALAGAVLLYRTSYQLFTWLFAAGGDGVLGWLGKAALAAGCIWVAGKLWSRWRLLFGGALAFFAIWSVAYRIPRIDESVAVLGDDRWGFIHRTATYANAVVLLVVAVVVLFADRILAWWASRPSGGGSA